MATQDQSKQGVPLEDHVEQISAQARQTTRETARAAQQAQQTAAENTERLSEQGGKMATTAFDTITDSWMAALGMVSWSQDQAEQFARQLMEQGRVSREEGTRLLAQLGEQAKRNQTELQRMIQEGVRAGMQSYQFPEAFLQPMMTMMTPPQPAPTAPAVSNEQLDELSRKVDELNKKLDRLNARTTK